MLLTLNFRATIQNVGGALQAHPAPSVHMWKCVIIMFRYHILWIIAPLYRPPHIIRHDVSSRLYMHTRGCRDDKKYIFFFNSSWLLCFYFPKGATAIAVWIEGSEGGPWAANQRVCSVLQPSRLALQGVCSGDGLLTGWRNVWKKKCRHTMKTERDFCVYLTVYK